MPWRAMSIIPLLIAAPINTPIEATITILLKEAALKPIAELRKFTASLLTPTDKSNMARRNKKTTTHKNTYSIKNKNPVFCTLQSKPDFFSKIFHKRVLSMKEHVFGSLVLLNYFRNFAIERLYDFHDIDTSISQTYEKVYIHSVIAFNAVFVLKF